MTCENRFPDDIGAGGEITFLDEGLGAGLTGLVTCEVGLNNELILLIIADTVLIYNALARTSRAWLAWGN